MTMSSGFCFAVHRSHSYKDKNQLGQNRHDYPEEGDVKGLWFLLYFGTAATSNPVLPQTWAALFRFKEDGSDRGAPRPQAEIGSCL